MDNTDFEVPGVSLGEGIGGLPRLEISTELFSAEVYLHGAHVTEFTVRGQKPLLFMSARSQFAEGKPIRGGVPVIFPWFGPCQGRPEAPAHGFARTRAWAVESVAEEAGGAITAVLRLEPDSATRALWLAPESQTSEWVLRHRITFGLGLTMELEIQNNGSAPLVCEEALHTYFSVSDVRQIAVAGLEGAEYVDRLDGGRKRQADAIRFTGETDRTYVNTASTCEIDDPGFDRRIVIEKHGSNATVVWNPWIAKAKAMPDFGDDEWPFMVCVETGNMAENGLKIASGAMHVTRTVIRTVPG